MRVLMLPRYDAQGASSRLRMLQYVPSLQADGIDVDVSPLLDDGYFGDLYAFAVSIFPAAPSYGACALWCLQRGLAGKKSMTKPDGRAWGVAVRALRPVERGIRPRGVSSI